jgi:hypothetical protein
VDNLLLLLLLLLLTASGDVPGGSGATIHNTQYNTILCYTIHKKHKITHTHSQQYITQELQTLCTQNYKNNVST